MELEWFDPQIGTPTVSIADYGLTFSRSAVEILSRPTYIALGFDKQNKRIVVKEVPEDHKGKIPFIEKERNGYVRINNKDFVRFIMRYLPTISFTSKAIRYLSYYDQEKELLIVDLQRPLDEKESKVEDAIEEE